MKKIFSVYLILILILWQFPVTYASANPKVYIENTDYLTSRTDHVLVPVKMDSLPTDASDVSKISYGGAVLYVTYDTDKLEYTGVKSGTMLSKTGASVAWAPVQQAGEVQLGFVSDSTVYSKGSFEKDTKDCLLYLEFTIKQKTVGDKIPVNLTRAELGAIGDVNNSLISSSSTLDMENGFVYISDYNYVNSFSVEVYTDKDGTAVTQKYPVIVDNNARNKFYVVACPNSDGIVKAKIIPDFKDENLSLVISCSDARVIIDGTSIEIPADLSIKQADLTIRVQRADGSIDKSGEYLLSVVRGKVTTEVVKENITTVVDADDLAGAIDTKADALAGVSTEITLVVKQNEALEEDITKIKDEIGSGASIFYFDVSLLVTKINSENETITENEKVENTINPVTVKIKIPSNMLQGSDYKVVRVHNGVAEVIDTTREGNYLIFKTDKFSQYAISYTPARSSSGGGGSHASTPTPTASPTPTTTLTDTHAAYMKGYPDHTFKAESSITRAETAAIIARITDGFSEKETYNNKFNDVTAGEWYTNYIGFIQDKNIVSGYPDGTFQPDNNITRAEFAAVISRYKALNTQEENTLLFSDTVGHWCEKYIFALYSAGYISGYPDHTFQPDANITRAEAVKMINAAIGRTPNEDSIKKNISKYQISFNDVPDTYWAYYEILETVIDHNTADFH